MRKIVRTIKDKNGTYDPFYIAKNENIHIEYIEYNSSNFGEFILFGNKKIILLSNLVKDKKKSIFILSHELGHYFLNHKESLKGVSRLDFEANFFAAELLYNLYTEKHKKKATKPIQLVEYGMPLEMAMFV